MNWDGKYWKGVFSEADGTPSFSRVISGFAAFFAFGWITAIVVNHLWRHVSPEFPDFAGLIAFISIFYGINQARNLLQKPPQA